jgi:hypothetical protein
MDFGTKEQKKGIEKTDHLARKGNWNQNSRTCIKFARKSSPNNIYFDNKKGIEKSLSTLRIWVNNLNRKRELSKIYS